MYFDRCISVEEPLPMFNTSSLLWGLSGKSDKTKIWKKKKHMHKPKIKSKKTEKVNIQITKQRAKIRQAIWELITRPSQMDDSTGIYIKHYNGQIDDKLFRKDQKHSKDQVIKYSDAHHNFTLSHDVGLRAFGAQARMLVFYRMLS